MAGVSTRKVEQLVEAMGAKGMSRSEVSRLAKELDAEVTAFRERPLDGPFRYIWLDAMYPKVREGQRVVGLAVLVAIGVNQQGYREVLGLEVADGEMESAWSGFLDSLVKRGLTGVELVVSDAPYRPKGRSAAGPEWGFLAAMPGALHAQRRREAAQGRPGGLPGAPQASLPGPGQG